MEGIGRRRFCFTITDFLPTGDFQKFVAIVDDRIVTKRVNIVAHKRGATMSYRDVNRYVPEIAGFYRSPELHDEVSRIMRIRVQPTPEHDQSSCSILVYDDSGDRIGWHYDHNFYNGRHFTVLLPMVNEQLLKPRQLSSAQLVVNENGVPRVIPTPPNTLVLFE